MMVFEMIFRITRTVVFAKNRKKKENENVSF
jgi:hypothetical protein